MFNMSDEEFLRNQREMFYDRQFEASLEAVAEAVAGDAAGGLGLGGEGELGELGELGDEGELGGEGELGELGGEGELGEPGGEEAAGGDEGALLAAPPGKRKDQPTPKSLTKKSRHPYVPTKSDSRGIGARKRSNQGLWSRETASSTSRNINKGFSDIMGLRKTGVSAFEHVMPNYDEDLEEHKLFEVSYEAQRLIESLESKKNENETQQEEEHGILIRSLD